MAEDMAGKISEILSNPEMMKELSGLIGMMNQKSSESAPAQSNEDIVLGAKQLMDTLNTSNDRRINLLNALKPYVRESRASGIDKAIKMLKITKLTDIMKNERS